MKPVKTSSTLTKMEEARMRRESLSSEDRKSLDEVFLSACKARYYSGIEVSLSNGADINRFKGFRRFMGKSGVDFDKYLKLFLEYGYDINAADKNGLTSLMDAALGLKSLKHIPFLIKNGADPLIELERDGSDVRGIFSLLAINDPESKISPEQEKDLSNAVKCIVEECCRRGRPNFVNERDHKGNAPIHIAAKENNCPLLNALIENGANPRAVSGKGNNIIHLLANNRSNKYFDLTPKYVHNINVISHDGDRPIHIAVRNGNHEIIDDLAKYGADMNAKNVEGELPLQIAVDKGNTKMVQLLIRNGAKLGVKDKNQDSLLHKAIYNRDVEMVELLISCGANVNEPNGNGDFPIHLVCNDISDDKYKNTLLTFLVRSGADINMPNAAGDGIIHILVRNNNLGSLDKVIKMGGDINMPNAAGDGIIHILVRNNNLGSLDKVIKMGGDINMPDGNGDCPIHIALSSNELMIKFIMDHNPDLNIQNNQGKYPIQICPNLAIRNGELDYEGSIVVNFWLMPKQPLFWKMVESGAKPRFLNVEQIDRDTGLSLFSIIKYDLKKDIADGRRDVMDKFTFIMECLKFEPKKEELQRVLQEELQRACLKGVKIKKESFSPDVPEGSGMGGVVSSSAYLMDRLDSMPMSPELRGQFQKRYGKSSKYERGNISIGKEKADLYERIGGAIEKPLRFVGLKLDDTIDTMDRAGGLRSLSKIAKEKVHQNLTNVKKEKHYGSKKLTADMLKTYLPVPDLIAREVVQIFPESYREVFYQRQKQEQVPPKKIIRKKSNPPFEIEDLEDVKLPNKKNTIKRRNSISSVEKKYLEPLYEKQAKINKGWEDIIREKEGNQKANQSKNGGDRQL